LILLFSGQLRARLRVLINKHFFHYKYDYREEWLRFIRTFHPATRIFTPGTRYSRYRTDDRLSGGILWLRRDNGRFEPEAQWHMDLEGPVSEPSDSSLIRFLEIQKWVINLTSINVIPAYIKVWAIWKCGMAQCRS